jgi:hypothetical protein
MSTIDTSPFGWDVGLPSTAAGAEAIWNAKPCNSEKHLVYTCDDEGGCDGRRRQSNVSKRE